MLVESSVGICRGGRSQGVLGPAEDEVTISRGGRDLGARLAILFPDPAVHTSVDNLEMSAVDILIQRAVRGVAGINVRRDVTARRKPSVVRPSH
jgi:hypothetical protein